MVSFNTAQAEREHARALARKAKDDRTEMPASEDEALRAYKRAHYLVAELHDRKWIKALEAHAESNGWDALSEWNTERDARNTARREREALREQDAAHRAAQLTSRQEAIELHKHATTVDDDQLAAAIERTAKNKGWNLMPTDINDLATQLHIGSQMILAAHDQASAKYRDDLRAGRVTPEYVKAQLADSTATEQLQDFADKAAAYFKETETDYDEAYSAIVAPHGDTQEQLLAEIRGGKAWERMQRELAAVPSDRIVEEMVSRILNADACALRTLIEEAPSYLASHGVRDADAIVRSAVHEARPELKEAQDKITAAAKLRDITSHNTKLITDRISNPTLEDIDGRGLFGYVNPMAEQ